MRESTDSRTRPSRARLLALLLSNCVTLDKLLHLSGLFFSKRGVWCLYLRVPRRALRWVWWWHSGCGHTHVSVFLSSSLHPNPSVQ